LPPLLLDDDEAVAVAIGLRTAAAGSVSGIEETSLRALTKMQQVLPSRLRHRVRAFEQATLPLPVRGPRVDPDVLAWITAAVRDHEVLRFRYVAHAGSETRRNAEPYRLVNDRGRWYLLAWDRDRDDWRIFRVDRLTLRRPNGPRFTPRPLPPDEEMAERMARRIGEATWRYRARVVVHAPAEAVRAKMPIPVDVEPLGEDRWLRARLGRPRDARSVPRLPACRLRGRRRTRARRGAASAGSALRAGGRVRGKR
jgi:predicted DNA-binding transcriptional regulator YafY